MHLCPDPMDMVTPCLPASPALPTGVGLDRVGRYHSNLEPQRATQDREQLGQLREAFGVLAPNPPDLPKSSEPNVPTSKVVEQLGQVWREGCAG